MKPLEVLHVVESLGEGGAEQNLLSFLKHMPADRYRHHMAWMFPDERLRERFRPHLATMIPLSAGKGARLLRTAWDLAGWVRKLQPDVIHAQLVRPQLIARAASLMAGRPPVVTTWQAPYYDARALSDFSGSPRRLSIVRLIDRLTSHIDTRFIAVSRHVANHCGEQLHIGQERVRVIYNAVEPSRYGQAEPALLQRTRAQLGLPPGALTLLTVGRLAPQKAQRDLVAAMPRVLQALPQAQLLVAGRGPLLDALKAQAQSLGVAHAVHLLGAREDVQVLYQLADLFVFPSLYEGLSVALLEALANGLPAVVSDIPQNREIADGLSAVRFTPVGDVEAIARGIIELCGTRESATQAARLASANVQARFSPDVLARQFGETLEQAAGLSA
jgi:glycosyltransferase involved in cell wall biosynthesis